MIEPTPEQADDIIFYHTLSEGVRRSNDLRLPADPERVLTLLQGRLAEINFERERGQG